MNGPTFAATAPPPAPRPVRPAAPARPARPDPDAGAGGRVLTYLRLHWLMILFCGTLLGGAGSYAAWELLPAKWESTAILQADQTQASVANAGNPNATRTEFGTYVKTVVALIRSDFVLNAALRDGGIADLPTIKDQKDPIKFLAEELVVNTPDQSEVIRLSMLGHRPGDVQKIVDAVQKAFMREVGEKDKLRRELLLNQIREARDEMMKDLHRKNGKPDPLAKGPVDGAVQQATAGAPGPLPRLAGDPPAAHPPAPADSLAVLAQVDPQKVIDRYAVVAQMIDQGPDLVQSLRDKAEQLRAEVKRLETEKITNPAVLAAVEKDPEYVRQAHVTADAKRQYDFAYHAASPDKKEAPGVVNLKVVWENQQAKLEKVKGDKAFQIEAANRLPKMEALTAQANEHVRQAEAAEARLKLAKEAEPGLRKAVAELPPRYRDVRAADGRPGPADKPYLPEMTDRDVQDAVLGGVAKQYYAQRVELAASGLERVRPVQPASVPIQKDTKKQILAAVAAGLLGYGLIAVGVVGFETLARRVSSLADLTAAGPAPVVGVIPYRPGAGPGDPLRQAVADEAVDRLRAFVGQAWLSRGATCVAVTSPVGDEGKAFAAFGLAGSLARAGYRTLLVDFDLRDPALHTLAGMTNGAGVCEVLRGEIEAPAVVVGLPGGLDFVPAGTWSEDARRAAVGGRLEALLGKLKEPYDCVVVNAHALLTAAEAVEVVRRCEAVLVCARYRETTVPLLRRATDRVAAMEVPFAGVVYVGSTDREALC